MYVWFTNFGYAYSTSPTSVEDGIEIMKRCAFEATLHDKDGGLIASYHPISGVKRY